MKKLALATVAISALLTGVASAADLAARPYTKAPMAAAVYNWTGFYVGLSGGGAWSDTRWQYFGAAVNTDHSGSGWLAGGQVGYNWQAGSWVFGLEADGHWADINGSTACPNAAFLCSTDVRTLASFRGRIGYAAGPVLFYGTGGAGYADTRYSATSPGANFFYTTDRWGYAAGAGIEWGFAPNWSAKVEYMHYGFDTDTAPILALSNTSTTNLRLDIDTVKVGINYRFGGPY